jgi:effector-binding domain-containing protein
MAYEIEDRELPARHTAVARGTTVPAAIGPTYQRLIAAVRSFLASAGVEDDGPAFGRYLEYRPDFVDMEVGVPVAEPVESSAEVSGGELPAGRVVSTWHIGAYTTLGAAYKALEEHVASAGLEATGAPWEVYERGPAEDPDSATWRTEIVQPVAPD